MRDSNKFYHTYQMTVPDDIVPFKSQPLDFET